MTCLDLYRSTNYEDERMKDHAEQLLSEIHAIIGELCETEENESDAAWENVDEADELISDGWTLLGSMWNSIKSNKTTQLNVLENLYQQFYFM